MGWVSGYSPPHPEKQRKTARYRAMLPGSLANQVPHARTEYVPPAWSWTCSGRQRHPLFMQSESAKHTSVHSFDVVSQNWLLQSVSLPHVLPWLALPAPGKQAAMTPVPPVVRFTYAQDTPCPPQSNAFPQALRQFPLMLLSQSSLWQLLFWLQLAPFAPLPPCPHHAT